MLPIETSASSGPAAHRARWCRTYPVSATSAALSAAFASAAVSSSRRSEPDPGPAGPALGASRAGGDGAACR
jgi:hypothetical protein